MDFSGTRVLILEGYARQCLPLIRSFSKLGCEVTALCNSKLDVAYASRYTKHKYLGICDRDRENDTEQQIKALLQTGKFDVVVPTVDFSASILARNKEAYSKYARVVSNDWEVYKIAGDKQKTMEICMQYGIPCPRTISNANSVDDIKAAGIDFPLVMKPRTGYGAIGFRKINDVQSLESALCECDKPFSHYVFQEFIPQSDLQFECAMFLDENSEVKTSLVFSKNRWYPIAGGSSTLNITVDRPDIVESCSRLLKAIHWRGAADIDLIQDPRDHVAKIMEINPRVSGSVKICFVSGVDQARQMLELAYGEPVTKYKQYNIGQRLRCSQTDLLWFFQSPNRWQTKPSWFSWRNTKEHTFYLDDPLPWFAFSIHGLLSYKKEMKKRNQRS